MATLPPYPSQPKGTPWPTDEWPVAEPAPDVDRAALEAALNFAFGDAALERTGDTRALLAVHRGIVVAERYADGLDAVSTLPSWSMAKSVLQAIVGLMVAEGRLSLHEPAPVPQWQTDSDSRRAITLDHLLRMSDGLEFREEYVDRTQSDVVAMLYGDGKNDVAAFAATFPLAHEPGTFWSYSSGTSNIVSGIVARALGSEQAYRDFMRHELFARIGMRTAAPRFDAVGTWIGSSFVFATARDFARFGLLYLRGGEWHGEQVLLREWIDYARTLAPACSTREYGAHWWMYPDRPDVFFASGYEGQRIVVAPAHDLVLVRSAKSQITQRPAIQAFMLSLVDAFPRVSPPPGSR